MWFSMCGGVVQYVWGCGSVGMWGVVQLFSLICVWGCGSVCVGVWFSRYVGCGSVV